MRHCSSCGYYHGQSVGVHDGDTLTILTPAKDSIKVRLHGIDAPESKQAFGSRSKQELSALAFGKQVTVEVMDKDRYGRTVGRVFVGTMDVNVEMVRRGFAWWYRSYAKKDMELSAAEAAAKGSRRGLWADKDPIAPWDWRENESKARRNSGARCTTGV